MSITYMYINHLKYFIKAKRSCQWYLTTHILLFSEVTGTLKVFTKLFFNSSLIAFRFISILELTTPSSFCLSLVKISVFGGGVLREFSILLCWCLKDVWYAGGQHSHSHDPDADHADHDHFGHDHSHSHSLKDLSVGMSILG